MICKFVFKGDKEIGESIDVYNEHLIVKVEADFIAIPLKNIERIEDDRIIISEFDENEAKKAGEKWVTEKSKPIRLEELKAFGFEDLKIEDEVEKSVQIVQEIKGTDETSESKEDFKVNEDKKETKEIDKL